MVFVKMQRAIKLWIYICFLIGYQTAAVPVDFDGMESDREVSYDFDTEQSQARYDPRVLSEELKDRHLSSQERAASCYTSNLKYEHGEKVARNDPCEVCLCVDGEIFCWWKKCDHNKRKKEMRKNKPQKILRTHKKQYPTKKSQPKFKMMKFIPKKFLSFPEHLPAMLHFDYNLNETKQDASDSSAAPIGSKRKIEIKPTPRSPFSAYDEKPIRPVNDQRQGSADINKDQSLSDSHNNQQPSLYVRTAINVEEASDPKVNKINDPNGGHHDLMNRKENEHSAIKYSDNISISFNRSTTEPSDFMENGNIQFVDVPLAKHYIITSSGSVENADILASENILSQFRSGYNIIPQPMSSIPDGNVSDTLHKSLPTSRKDVIAPPIIETSTSASTAIPVHVTAETASKPISSLSQQQIDASPVQGSSSTEPPQQECVVMGTSYKIGTILPQDTGNCLQCICIEGADTGDSPRVTCSPHNCPPLVLPDLFDTTGY